MRISNSTYRKGMIMPIRKFANWLCYISMKFHDYIYPTQKLKYIVEENGIIRKWNGKYKMDQRGFKQCQEMKTKE